MTKEDILKLSGRELDEAVAEKAMGWERYSGRGWPVCIPCFDDRHGDVFKITGTNEDSNIKKHWSPSKSITDAWEVVEKHEFVYLYKADMDIGDIKKGQWECKLMRKDGTKDCYIIADTAPLAICRAALLAVLEK